MSFGFYDLIKCLTHNRQYKGLIRDIITALFAGCERSGTVPKLEHRKNVTLITKLSFKIIVVLKNRAKLTHQLGALISVLRFSLIRRIRFSFSRC